MDPGDPVRVTNLDGNTAEGTIDEIHWQTVEEYPAGWLDVKEATLMDYWRGHDVDPAETVVMVELGSRAYPYPESRVEVLEDA